MYRLSLPFAVAFIVLLGTSSSSGQRRSDFDEDNNYDEYWPRENARVFQPVPVQPPPPPQDPNVILVPRLGLVRGKVAHQTIKNRAVSAFLGIKYGVVGRGLARFQPATAVPVGHSNAIIDATAIPANCPQFPDLEQIRTAESRGDNVDDCLTLNIHTPNLTASLPVLVFVHGEMLFDGSAEEGQPDYFLEHDVVLVSVNYRLAPFGFLSTQTEEIPGNVALADVQLSLEWIQQHIRFFGGDNQKVTLIGQAGGSTLVHVLSLSGKAPGLFHRLILQSGTALNPYLLDEDPLRTASSFARIARCPYGVRGEQQLHRCLERLSTTELLEAFKTHWENNEPLGARFTGAFKLVVGDKLGYLPQHPSALVANNAYPTIAGVTKDAGAFILSRFYKKLAVLRSSNITSFIDVVLEHTTQPRHYALWRSWALQHIFTEQNKGNPTLNDLAQGLLELTNLILYRGPVIDSIRYTWRKFPTYLYCFDYRGEFHRFGHLSNPLPFEADATLSDDNIYLFPYPKEVSQLNPEDRSISRALTTMWVNFATYGVPNFNVGVWPNVTTEYGPFLRVTNSKENTLELDYHFGEGIPVPNLYPEYFTTTTTTTTARPRPAYPNYNQPQQQQYQQPAYRAHETVLNGPSYNPNPRYPNYNPYSQNGHSAPYTNYQRRY